MNFEIRKLDLLNNRDLELAYPIMHQLRSHLSFEEFKDLLSKMIKENYELWAAFENNQIVGLVSVRLYTDLVRGTHLYIDDLVTDQKQRSKGLGAKLLKHVEKLSKDSGCESLRLCCALSNESANKFYKREGWSERSLAFVKKTSL